MMTPQGKIPKLSGTNIVKHDSFVFLMHEKLIALPKHYWVVYKVFLKFYDNISYSFALSSSTKKNYSELESIGASEAATKTYPYQKIETLDGINKFRANVKHKSNMFSINIKNTGISQLSIGSADDT